MSTASIIGYLAGGELTAHIGSVQTIAIAGYLFIAASVWSFGFSAMTLEIPRLDDRLAGGTDTRSLRADEDDRNNKLSPA